VLVRLSVCFLKQSIVTRDVVNSREIAFPGRESQFLGLDLIETLDFAGVRTLGVMGVGSLAGVQAEWAMPEPHCRLWTIGTIAQRAVACPKHRKTDGGGYGGA